MAIQKSLSINALDCLAALATTKWCSGQRAVAAGVSSEDLDVSRGQLESTGFASILS